MWYRFTTSVVIADIGESREPARATFAHNRRRMDGWMPIPTGRTKNEGERGTGVRFLRELTGA
jgi:hypothetical protein